MIRAGQTTDMKMEENYHKNNVAAFLFFILVQFENACCKPKEMKALHDMTHSMLAAALLSKMCRITYDFNAFTFQSIRYGGSFCPGPKRHVSCCWVESRRVRIRTRNKLQQSLFGSRPRPPQKVGLSPVVWSGPGFMSVFTPAQKVQNKGENNLWPV
ncbi:hypothetical protein ILYODFUR_024169 [Ilyodon furcidens]|uniref:Uncharacterized protein n=1 Tax=Ilyodon furcidens TaxID=33524 RepID=A0ABV0TLH3_9TELE